MTAVILVFMGAISLFLIGAYRSALAADRVDPVTGGAFGFNLGLVWGVGLLGIGLMEWGTDALAPLIIIGAVLTFGGTALGVTHVLVRRRYPS